MSAPFGLCVPADFSAGTGSWSLAEFFAGIGLASVGFGAERIDRWKVTIANDICETKAKRYRENFPDAPFVLGSITDITADQIPRSDVWTSSSPCQDVSSAGLRYGLSGSRSSLAFTVVDLLEQAVAAGTAPYAVLFENVPGLLADAEGVARLHERIVACGYRIGAFLFDALHYLPVSRRRVFIVAVRGDVQIPAGCSTDSPNSAWVSKPLKRVWASLSVRVKANWIWWSIPPIPPRTLQLSDILEDVPPEKWSGPREVARFLGKLPQTQRKALEKAKAAGHVVYGVSVEKTDPNQPAVPEAYEGGERKRRLATFRVNIAYTLLATATGTSRQKLIMVCGNQIQMRDFTPREVARLMGVPEWFTVPDTIGKAMSAFGDALAVPVVRHIVKSLIEPIVDAAKRQFERVEGAAPIAGPDLVPPIAPNHLIQPPFLPLPERKERRLHAGRAAGPSNRKAAGACHQEGLQPRPTTERKVNSK